MPAEWPEAFHDRLGELYDQLRGESSRCVLWSRLSETQRVALNDRGEGLVSGLSTLKMWTAITGTPWPKSIPTAAHHAGLLSATEMCSIVAFMEAWQLRQEPDMPSLTEAATDAMLTALAEGVSVESSIRHAVESADLVLVRRPPRLEVYWHGDQVAMLDNRERPGQFFDGLVSATCARGIFDFSRMPDYFEPRRVKHFKARLRSHLPAPLFAKVQSVTGGYRLDVPRDRILVLTIDIAGKLANPR